MRLGVVRAEGFEPPRLSSREPKSRASTSSATPAKGTLGAQRAAGRAAYITQILRGAREKWGLRRTGSRRRSGEIRNRPWALPAAAAGGVSSSRAALAAHAPAGPYQLAGGPCRRERRRLGRG